MSRVKQLGYVGFEVSDGEAWDDLLVTVAGLQARTDCPPGTRTYRIDEHHHCLTLHEGSADRLAYLGWEMATQIQLDTLVTGLDKDGAAIEEADAALCRERGVMQAFVLRGPDDVRIELYYGRLKEAQTLRLRGVVTGFNTGALGMGHVVLASADKPAALRWYQDKLGFSISDHVHCGTRETTFLFCNQRHHSLAISNTGSGPGGNACQRLMLETSSIDDVGRAYDIVHQRQYPVALTYGRHSHDGSFSFALHTPSGWQLELGAGGLLIEDDHWQPRLFNAPTRWGHAAVPAPAAGS